MRKAENKHVWHSQNFRVIINKAKLTSYTMAHELVAAISVTSASILRSPKRLSNGDHVQENLCLPRISSLCLLLYRIDRLTGSTLRDRLDKTGLILKCKHLTQKLQFVTKSSP